MPQHNELLTAKAFSRQSEIFDDIYASNTIVQYKRERVRAVVHKYAHKGGHILELNAGTGEDAIYFAEHGYTIHATDNAAGMLEKLNSKVKNSRLEKIISTEQCSFTSLDRLQHKGPYDLIFSNFAGLNCTDKLQQTLSSFDSLLNDKGIIILVILPPFCLWEIMLAFKGKFKTAFRRFNSRNGRIAHVEGVRFTCWYYKPSFIIKTLANKYNLLALEGLCTAVPPSYIEHFAEKYPSFYRFLKEAENKIKNKWPWNRIGDYYIIAMQKK